MKHNVLLLTMAAALFASGMTFKAHAAADRAFPRRAVGERVKEKLGLTDEQLRSIKSKLAAEKDSLTEVLRREHSARTELRKAIESDASESSIREAAAKVAAVEADAAVLRARLHKSISPILTDEQTAKLKDLRARAGDFVDRLIDKIGERRNK